MSYQVNDPALIKEILTSNPRIAIVGLSPKPERDSNRVAKYLMANGFEVVPVNPMTDEILGLKSYKSLDEIPGKVDVVDVFRRAEDALPIAQKAVEIEAKYLWLQLSVINDDAAKVATDAGLGVIMDRCIKIEHQRM